MPKSAGDAGSRPSFPPHRVRQLRKIAAEAKRGPSKGGVAMLFSGPSGTGRTMAAEIIAGELGVDLLRVDLSQTVSRFIGETEKNLRQLFASAEAEGAVLLLDEADALFGKRSEVKDSHDRYANVDPAYLEKLLETHEGIVILGTSRKSALDSAFLRRLRFVVDFPDAE